VTCGGRVRSPSGPSRLVASHLRPHPKTGRLEDPTQSERIGVLAVIILRNDQFLCNAPLCVLLDGFHQGETFRRSLRLCDCGAVVIHRRSLPSVGIAHRYGYFSFRNPRRSNPICVRSWPGGSGEISPAARKIVERSRFFYKDALLTLQPEEYQKAALGLAKIFFMLK